MSAKIIPFPKQTDILGEDIHEYIRAYLAEITADIDFINHVSHRMSHFIEKYATRSFEPILNLMVPSNMSPEEADALLLSIDKGIQYTSAEVQDMVRNIIMERLYLEIQIYAGQKRTKYDLL